MGLLRFLADETLALLNPVQAYKDMFLGQHEASSAAIALRRAGCEVEIEDVGGHYRLKVTFPDGLKVTFPEDVRRIAG